MAVSPGWRLFLLVGGEDVRRLVHEYWAEGGTTAFSFGVCPATPLVIATQVGSEDQNSSVKCDGAGLDSVPSRASVGRKPRKVRR